MKKLASEFFLRGLIAGGFGPIVLAVVYLILNRAVGVETLSVSQLCVGILSLYALAFIVGGLNVLYRIERLPLTFAILIHGGVLYVCYLITYLLNGWIENGVMPIIVFSLIFIIGFVSIWVVIFSVTKVNTKKVNEALKQKRQSGE
jgi:hypothetical protein